MVVDDSRPRFVLTKVPHRVLSTKTIFGGRHWDEPEFKAGLSRGVNYEFHLFSYILKGLIFLSLIGLSHKIFTAHLLPVPVPCCAVYRIKVIILNFIFIKISQEAVIITIGAVIGMRARPLI